MKDNQSWSDFCYLVSAVAFADDRLDPDSKLLLLVLTNHINKHSAEIQADNSVLAKQTRLTKKQLSITIKRLQQAGWIFDDGNRLFLIVPKAPKADIKFWSHAHTDAWHPGSRERCEHCQAMIRLFGPMPSVKEIMAHEKGQP